MKSVGESDQMKPCLPIRKSAFPVKTRSLFSVLNFLMSGDEDEDDENKDEDETC